MRETTILRDALYNLVPSSGADDSYCRGIVVGLAAGMMARGVAFDVALRKILAALPVSARPLESVMPEGWCNAE